MRLPRRWALLGAVLALLFALPVLAVVFHEPLLTGLARAWIVDEPLGEADAILVLGGGIGTRPFVAARLYHEGYAPRVLVLNVALSATDEIGLTVPETDMLRQILIAEGVPETAIETIGHGVSSSYEEARALRRWVERSGPERVIVPTDVFHTRRVNTFFEKELRGTGVDLTVHAIEGSRYSAGDWWREERGLIDFQNEIVKYGYYAWKY